MKKTLLFSSALAFVLLGTAFESVDRVERVHNRSAAPAGYTGSPGDGRICTECHGGSATEKTGIISSDIPVDGYVPGSTYTITVTLNNPGTTRFGFQLSPQNATGTQLGSWGGNTSDVIILAGKYASHRLASTDANDTKTWTMQWTAPAAGTGDVTFYGAFNISNANNSESGDQIWKSSMKVSENGASKVADADVLEMKAFVSQSGSLQVQWDGYSNQKASVRLFDMNGKEVAIWNNVSRENALWQAALPQLQAGIYLLQVESAGKSATQKLILR